MASAVLTPAAIAARRLLPTMTISRPIRVHDSTNWPIDHGRKKIQRLDRDAGDAALEHLQAFAARIDALPAGRECGAADQQREAGNADQDRIGAEIADQHALHGGDDDAEQDRHQKGGEHAERQARQENQRRRRDASRREQSDMMLPVIVMNVMPTATQPMNEIALSRALMLSGEVKPGVLSAKIAMAPPAMMRIASTSVAGARMPSETKPGAQRNVAHAAATGWVISASTRCMSASPRR